jgi:SAM-dependent methyltransferase
MFTSFRRHYLDQMLSTADFSGDVLDVGGKKENKKGLFRPPLDRCRSWRYVNIEPSTSPDFLASADQLPLGAAEIDCVLLAETLEHLEFPEKALAEAARVLRPGGRLLLTVPFLYPVHADPYDFQRWTPEKFRRTLAPLGFTEISVQPMGGLFAVIVDSFEAFCQAHYMSDRKLGFGFRFARKLLRSLLIPGLLRRDARLPFRDIVTGGYFVTATRRA